MNPYLNTVFCACLPHDFCKSPRQLIVPQSGRASLRYSWHLRHAFVGPVVPFDLFHDCASRSMQHAVVGAEAREVLEIVQLP